MNDEAMIDLVQAGVDGELDDAGREALDRLLATSEDARRIHGELTAVSHWLGQAEPVEPPDDLHARIMAGIELPAPRRRWLDFLRSDAALPLGYGLAAALGVVVTLGVLGQRDAITVPGDTRDLVGTLAPMDQGAQVGASRFEYAGGQGEVLLTRHAEGYRLDFAIRGEMPVDWRLDLGDSGLELASLATVEGTPAAVDWRGGGITGGGDTVIRFSAGLSQAEGANEVRINGIELDLGRAGESLYQGRLAPVNR